MSCIQYPESGRELTYGVRQVAKTRKRVVVVGGGPGGMKTAVVAAERGHRVKLYESSQRLGGQALLAQGLPGRMEFGGLITHLEREIAQLEIEVVKGTTATVERIVDDAPDAVVIATGAIPYRPTGEFENANVVTAWDVIEGRAEIVGNVVVADWRCDWIGPGVAEQLATEGHSVRLCVNGETMGQSIQSYVRHIWAGRLHRLGVEVMPYLRLFGADEDTVYMQHIMTQDPVLLENAGTLVLAYGHQSVNALSGALENRFAEFYEVGDCINPRTAGGGGIGRLEGRVSDIETSTARSPHCGIFFSRA